MWKLSRWNQNTQMISKVIKDELQCREERTTMPPMLLGGAKCGPDQTRHNRVAQRLL